MFKISLIWWINFGLSESVRTLLSFYLNTSKLSLPIELNKPPVMLEPFLQEKEKCTCSLREKQAGKPGFGLDQTTQQNSNGLKLLLQIYHNNNSEIIIANTTCIL